MLQMKSAALQVPTACATGPYVLQPPKVKETFLHQIPPEFQDPREPSDDLPQRLLHLGIFNQHSNPLLPPKRSNRPADPATQPVLYSALRSNAGLEPSIPCA